MISSQKLQLDICVFNTVTHSSTCVKLFCLNFKMKLILVLSTDCAGVRHDKEVIHLTIVVMVV